MRYAKTVSLGQRVTEVTLMAPDSREEKERNSEEEGKRDRLRSNGSRGQRDPGTLVVLISQ